MPSRRAIGATVVIALFGVMFPRSGLQTPAVRVVDEKALREYTGVYRWESTATNSSRVQAPLFRHRSNHE
jgi:hypothetical protein